MDHSSRLNLLSTCALAGVLLSAGCTASTAALGPGRPAPAASVPVPGGAPATSATPTPVALPTLAPTPDGWRTVPADDDSLAFAIPPDYLAASADLFQGPDVTAEGWVLVAFDARDADPARLTLVVAGWPRDGREVARADLARWSRAKLAAELAGEQDARLLGTTRMTLPLGPAIRYLLALREPAGIYHLALYHIWTPRGIVHLSAGAYGDKWALNDHDFSIIPSTLRLVDAGPGMST